MLVFWTVSTKGEKRLIKSAAVAGGTRFGPRREQTDRQTGAARTLLPARQPTGEGWNPIAGGITEARGNRQKRTREDRSTDEEQEREEPPARR